MEVMRGGGEDDSGDGMQCSDHPFRNNPGGICAFCLQEKLGKLVSSSFPLPIQHHHASSSSPSSPPSFRSENIATSSTTRPPLSSLTPTATYATATSSSSSSTKTNGNDGRHYQQCYNTRSTRLPFLSAKKKKKKQKKTSMNSSSSSGSAASANSNITLKRSKSIATPSCRRGHSLAGADDFSPRKRNGFWSFLHLSSKSSAPTISTKISASAATSSTTAKPKDKCCSSSMGRKIDIVVEQDNSPTNTNTNTTGSVSGSSFEGKVSRSRSVGCGSRSFSGDFFERISTGFGDCTLRRVESQREGKHKVDAAAMKERVRCGGLFSGFMMITSSSSSTTCSSSSSSSSSYLVSSSSAADVAVSHGSGRGGRSTWGWAFASPMRAFSTKPSSKDNKRRDIIRDANENATPNLSAMPSLLAVRV